MIKILSIFLVLLGIYLFMSSSNNSNNEEHNKRQIITILSRQAARYAIASEQDKNIIIALLHANYSAGYLFALKDIATTGEIENTIGVNVLKFEKDIIDIQNKVTKKLVNKCREIIPKTNLDYLLRIAQYS